MKVMIIDDHPLVRKGLEMAVSLERDMHVVGTASDGRQALDLIARTNPDVALVDLRLPGEHGLNIIKEAKTINKHCRYIVLSSYASKEEIRQALSLKVDGYILKEALPEDVISSIRLVANGRKYFDPVVVQHAMAYEDDECKLSDLTSRELEVLSSLSQGLTNKDISEKMHISEHTVKKHLTQIFAKLGLKDRTQAALYAVSRGLNK